MKLTSTLFLCLTALFAYEIQAQCTGAQFQEVNGIAVIEAENGTLQTGPGRPAVPAQQVAPIWPTGAAILLAAPAAVLHGIP